MFETTWAFDAAAAEFVIKAKKYIYNFISAFFFRYWLTDIGNIVFYSNSEQQNPSIIDN